MLNRWFRQWHRWISIFITLPFSVTLVTGILLSTRAFNTWVQPSYPKINSELQLSFKEILEKVKAIPEARIQSWSDVSQIDVRPAQGNIRVRSKHNLWEIQIDGQTGSILSSAPRRVSWLVSLHEGAYFGPIVRYGLFFPSALGMAFLLVSGIYLYLKPWLKARKS